MRIKTLLGVSCFLVPQLLDAANVDWNVESGEWHEASNWDPAKVPNAGDDDTVRVNNGGVVTVTEDASARNVLVGSSGIFETNGLVIESSVTVTTTGENSLLGSSAGQFGSATVGGTWDLTGRTLTVGSGGTGELEILSGGSIYAGAVTFGHSASGNGAGEIGGTLTTAGGVTVGNVGTGLITLGSSGSISSSGATVGSLGSGTANISGLWNFTGSNFTVGSREGGTGSVTIENGGEIIGTASNNINLGNNATAYGEMIVKSGGRFTASNGGTMSVGNTGEGLMIIESGGRADTASMSIGAVLGSSGTISVSGIWTNTANLQIGGRVSGASDSGAGVLNVESGGFVSLGGAIYLGGGASGGVGHGTLTVKSGGNLETTNHILVGQADMGILNIENGATVKSVVGRIGTVASGSGTVNVAGIWEIGGESPGGSNNLTVGESGSGTLLLGNEGFISSYNMTFASAETSTAEVTVGNAATLRAFNQLLVGNNGTANLLIERGGAVVTTGTAALGYSATGWGNAVVRGKWTIDSTDLEVGRSGVGQLSIMGDGGSVNIAGGVGTVHLARGDEGAVGVLNIGGAVNGDPDPAEAPGRLLAAAVTGRDNTIVTSQLNFNHTGDDYLFVNADGDGIAIQNNVRVNIYAGTTSLLAASTYTAGTEVFAGTLLVNNTTGSGTGSGSVTVHEGATLGGEGTISGPTTINGILSPGNSIGTLNINDSVMWNSHDAWIWELGAAGLDMANYGTSDFLSITGDFTKGFGSSFVFDFANTGEGGWYRLMSWTGTSAFEASDFLATNLASGHHGEFVIDSGSLYLHMDVIPEPSTVALMLLSLAGVMTARRWTRRQG